MRNVRGKTLWTAIFAFLALPGIFAGLVPYVLVSVDPWRYSGLMSGVIILFGGLFGLVWCVRDFYVSGKGTLSPWDPPKHLVVVGLYRFSRNPMYMSVLILITGWAIEAGSPLLFVYLVGLALAFHLRVVLHEESWLAKQFGAKWKAYSANVPRWLPRLTPWTKSYERP